MDSAIFAMFGSTAKHHFLKVLSVVVIELSPSQVVPKGEAIITI
jgi:hypothetical protein